MEEQNSISDEMVLLTRVETAAIFGITLLNLTEYEKNGSIPKAIHISISGFFHKS